MATDTTSDRPAADEVAPAVPRTYQELAQEMLELREQYPPPEKGDCVPDAVWFRDNEAALYERYAGQHVAVLNRALVGHGWNELQLKIETARTCNVHPDRVLTVYLFTTPG